jgi:hypothetical protein
MWISIGGAIFLGGYDITKNVLDKQNAAAKNGRNLD